MRMRDAMLLRYLSHRRAREFLDCAMRQIILYLITNLGGLLLDVTTLLSTAAAIGLASAAVSLVLSKCPALRLLRY
jgi:hypothetical protein